jgi:acetoin utilization deacetylase AcuC-like enzyme
VLRAHDQQFVEFLRNAWVDWVAAGNRGEAIPDCWPARRMAQRRSNGIAGRLGYYAMAGETSIGAGTWEAASAAVDVALSGASVLGTARVPRLRYVALRAITPLGIYSAATAS